MTHGLGVPTWHPHCYPRSYKKKHSQNDRSQLWKRSYSWRRNKIYMNIQRASTVSINISINKCVHTYAYIHCILHIMYTYIYTCIYILWGWEVRGKERLNFMAKWMVGISKFIRSFCKCFHNISVTDKVCTYTYIRWE